MNRRGGGADTRDSVEGQCGGTTLERSQAQRPVWCVMPHVQNLQDAQSHGDREIGGGLGLGEAPGSGHQWGWGWLGARVPGVGLATQAGSRHGWGLWEPQLCSPGAPGPVGSRTQVARLLRPGSELRYPPESSRARVLGAWRLQAAPASGALAVPGPGSLRPARPSPPQPVARPSPQVVGPPAHLSSTLTALLCGRRVQLHGRGLLQHPREERGQPFPRPSRCVPPTCSPTDPPSPGPGPGCHLLASRGPRAEVTTLAAVVGTLVCRSLARPLPFV